MKQEILDYIKTQRVGVLAVEMMDGSPHGATVHFAHNDEPLQFFFETYREYRKTEALFDREISRATLVIGTTENDMRTLQIDGEVRLIHESEKELFDKVYFEKFPNKKEKSKDPKFISFTFIPKWWRFTDWTTPRGKEITLSTDE